jgi:hypothetical protein
MRLIQFLDAQQTRKVGVVADDQQTVTIVRDAARVYDLALAAARAGVRLEQLINDRLGAEQVDYDELIAQRRLLTPLDHPDPARCLVTGTGLTHLGGAQTRDAMHAKLNAAADSLSDSMKMFKLGLEGGRPAPDQIGVQPEWFYKGDGQCIVAPEQPLELPAFADDGGEEAELVGLYIIGDDAQAWRVGFALGNEYSDHKLERQNYLYLAHSKLRQCSFGPEMLLGDPPANIAGRTRIVRGEETVWEGELLTGEANMSHTLANLEHHHFKYDRFRRPGDVHVHYFGASALSCLSGFTAQPGDVFEISAPEFGRPLRNPLVSGKADNELVRVKTL